MAYLARRPGGRFDIRESVLTARGPRSRTLATFRGSLTPEVLERAAHRATRPLDPALLRSRAAELGIPVSERRHDRAARELLGALRAGASLDPGLAHLLREALAAQPASPPPAALREVAEWIGADDALRGRALRDLLRVSDRIVRSRDPVREREAARFPRIRSRRARVRSASA
ncbi:MAG TPA: hypothetical protein VMW19_04540 [Myxococcota bacterium]|nr:hypothetical protein [Myxococcota bacterium]